MELNALIWKLFWRSQGVENVIQLSSDEKRAFAAEFKAFKAGFLKGMEYNQTVCE